MTVCDNNSGLDADCVFTMLNLAAGELSEDDLAAWLRSHVALRGPGLAGSGKPQAELLP